MNPLSQPPPNKTGAQMAAESGRRTAGEITGNAAEVYSTLKMGLLFYRGYRATKDAGGSTEDAVRAGTRHAVAWLGFVVFTAAMLFMFLPAGAIAIINWYSDGGTPGFPQSISETRLWATFVPLGLITMAVQIICWLVLYSKLKDMLNTKRGRIYRLGFRIRRRYFLMVPWGWFVGAIMLSNVPIYWLT